VRTTVASFFVLQLNVPSRSISASVPELIVPFESRLPLPMSVLVTVVVERLVGSLRLVVRVVVPVALLSECEPAAADLQQVIEAWD